MSTLKNLGVRSVPNMEHVEVKMLMLKPEVCSHILKYTVIMLTIIKLQRFNNWQTNKIILVINSDLQI